MTNPKAMAIPLSSEIHKLASLERQARYTTAFAEKGLLLDNAVIIDSTVQRIYRMRKGILTSSRLINQRLSKSSIRWVPVMVTLTYAPEVEWEARHITQFIKCVTMWGKRAGYKLPYAWVMELQKKGKPHYHCIIWIPRRLRLPKADTIGWWTHGTTNTVRANNPYGYLSKYVSKAMVKSEIEQSVKVTGKKEIVPTFPKGARIHGIGGLEKYEANIIAWWKLPKMLRLGDEGSHVWRRRLGGGWVCIAGESKGLVVESEWGLSAINVVNKRVRLVRKAM
jgi:hypothetical protein